MNIAVVTDSTCDIPYDLVEKYQIQVVPNILIIEGKSIEDNREFSRQEFYNQLPGMSSFPTTATSSVGIYQTLYEKLFNSGVEQIISIHASQTLSGIFNTASTAALAFSGKVHVIDSGQVSLGLGFQVLAVAESIAQGLSMGAVIARLEDVQKRIRLVAMLDTLEFIRRSGRVSWARARLGNLLSLKPFVEVKEGLVLSLGEVRTRRKGIERLLTMMRNLGAMERLAILHSNAEMDARALLENLAPQVVMPPLLVNITTVIGAHVGPNGLGFVSVIAE
jgi:DegV family protein with EDD domain